MTNCPARRESDEVVCTRRECGLRWGIGEDRPECPHQPHIPGMDEFDAEYRPCDFSEKALRDAMITVPDFGIEMGDNRYRKDLEQDISSERLSHLWKACDRYRKGGKLSDAIEQERRWTAAQRATPRPEHYVAPARLCPECGSPAPADGLPCAVCTAASPYPREAVAPPWGDEDGPIVFAVGGEGGTCDDCHGFLTTDGYCPSCDIGYV